MKILFHFSGIECHYGAGVGSKRYEVVNWLKGHEECIDYVKENYPGANGITMHLPCEGGKFNSVCPCYAEYDLEYFANYTTCKFEDNDGNSKS